MTLIRPLALLVSLAALAAPPSHAADPDADEGRPLHKFLPVADKSSVSLAYQWLDICQEAAARDVDRSGARPTILSRQMAIWATAVYDAWAAYHPTAVGTRLGNSLRQPAAAHTPANKEAAISAASHRALSFVYPESKAFLDAEMVRLGFNPNPPTTPSADSPPEIGLRAANAVIDFRRRDGSNQDGSEAGSNGQPYSDFTFYQPINPPDRIIDPDRWQPITFTKPDGSSITPGFLTPHWYRVKPFALESSSQFRPPPPPKTTTTPEELRKQTDAVLAYNRQLDHRQKAIVEFMRDGPRSTGQSGHWLRFAQDVSRRDHHNLDKDVQLYFCIANAAFDAFISCWETKRVYDSSRPWTLIHHFYKDQPITGWAGPNGGTREMKGQDWHPYSPPSFVTPPFPGYTSGHATVSGACAKIMELFTGSDTYGFAERRRHCELTEKNPGDLITLDLPTWSSTAEMAALSRALGGYHIPIDNDIGLKVGREIAVWSFPKYQAYFNGSASVRP